MYQVFISYRRNGGIALAYLLYEKLTKRGYKVFLDVDSLSNDKFDEKIFEVIDECDNVILVLSPDSLIQCNDSGDWVRREMAHALTAEKNIIPVVMDGFQWPKELPNDIVALQHYNGIIVSFHYFTGVVDRIIDYMQERLSKSDAVSRESDQKHILLWADFEASISEKLIRRMRLPDEYYIETLTSPSEILSKPIDLIDSIILLNTDVTKLADSNVLGKRINETLENYVECGGRLIGSHDLIYRRTRNHVLQRMFGCVISEFAYKEATEYRRTDACEEFGVFNNTPESFSLHDGEICWGNLSPDADVLYEDAEGIPLVFVREYGNGVCVYLNSGDYKENAPLSILKPEKGFVSLLKDSILMPVDYCD